MSTSAEKQPTWVINPAASNNRGTGLDAANALRDSAELTQRRWPRGKAFINQPTTIRYMGAIPAGDALQYDDIVIGPAGHLTISCDRTAVGSASTFSAVTNFSSGSQDQEVTGTGLGSQVGKQIEITASATPSHVGAIAHIAAVVSGNNVRTSPFVVPKTDGTELATGITSVVLPSVGDTFQVYDLPVVPAGVMNFSPGHNVSSSDGGGFGYLVLKYINLKSAGTRSSSAIKSDLSYPFFVGCWLDRVRVMMVGSRLHACKGSNVYWAGGGSLHTGTLWLDGAGVQTQLIFGHYMDLQCSLAQGGGGIPYTYAGSTLILNHVSAYSATYGLQVDPNGFVLIENSIWGSGHSSHGVRIAEGAKLFASNGSTRAITGTSGDILRAVTAGSTGFTHAWSEGTFVDQYGGGVIVR